MSVTTTFGYSAAEDRLWVSCSAWNTRLWLTRRMAQSVVSSVAQVLETVAAQPAGEPAPPGAEGLRVSACAEHTDDDIDAAVADLAAAVEETCRTSC